MMTDTRHRVTDRPIKILRHQSAGLQKCSMKVGQSLFSLFAHSPAHATRGSWFAARISHSLSRRSSGRDFRAKELTLPPTLLAARGSRLEYHTRFLAAPSAGILEQKRDCSQSNPNPALKRLTIWFLALEGKGSYSFPLH